LIRTGAFVTKEITEVRRQPRLVLSLILGPFLILLIFGIGYIGETGNLSAVIVTPESGEYSQSAEDYEKLVSGQIDVELVTTDLEVGLARLRGHEVDIVLVVPENAAQQIASGAQAIMPVFFNEVDPLRRDYITYFVYLATNELNKQTLAAAAGQGQESAGDFRAVLARLRNSLAAVENRLQQGDRTAANEQVEQMRSSSANMQLGLILLSQVLNTNTAMVKPADGGESRQVNLAESQSVAGRLNTDLEALQEELRQPNPDQERVRERVSRVRADIDDLDRLTQQFQRINPLVLAAPFYAAPENKAPVPTNFTSFYAPSVLVLLLQHIGVTLAALSIVRERLLGTVELFRVSPVSPSEILSGKYISFTIFLGVVAGALLLLMSNEFTVGGFNLSLGVPILGNWALLVLTLVLVIFASLGLGFLIASLSRSESQAVQLSMLVLLVSVFFSGFFLRIETFWLPVRILSYFLPVTYGIQSLQTVMLRGGTPTPALLIALLMLGAFFGLLSYVLFNREFRRG
jgi:ABC-2 type transport system permease protein